MKKTKIDWCDSTINCVYGCPNNCKYCYGNVMNKRFHFCKDWSKPEWKPEHLKDFYSKKPKSIFIDSMSDIGTWKQEWLKAIIKAVNDNPQHRYIALTKRADLLSDKLIALKEQDERQTRNFFESVFWGISVCTQAQADGAKTAVDFFSIEPILEPIELQHRSFPKTLIIGAETGNRKGKVIPQKEWIDNLVKQADEHKSVVFMKESLRKLMGGDFRQDKLPWEIEKWANRTTTFTLHEP